MSTPHDPTEECFTQHCHIHHIDEDDKGAHRVCGECFHVYRTARELRREERRAWWQIAAGERWWRRFRRVVAVRASRTFTCPHCSHDL